MSYCPKCHDALSDDLRCEHCGWTKRTTRKTSTASKPKRSSKSGEQVSSGNKLTPAQHQRFAEKREEEARWKETAIEGEVVDLEITEVEKEDTFFGGTVKVRRAVVTLDDGRRFRLKEHCELVMADAIREMAEDLNRKQWEEIEEADTQDEDEEEMTKEDDKTTLKSLRKTAKKITAEADAKAEAVRAVLEALASGELSKDEASDQLWEVEATAKDIQAALAESDTDGLPTDGEVLEMMGQAPDPEKMGKQAADEAKEAAGTKPINTDGECIIPAEPQPGDWEWLEGELGREPTDDEADAFADAYAERAEYHRAPWARRKRLVELLDASGMTQQEFGEWLGLGKGAQRRVSEYVRGVRCPSAQTLELAELKAKADA